jgi:hypothetical protein
MESTSPDVERLVQDLPCWGCSDPRGADLRFALAQSGGAVDEKQCSPASGLPWGCCRIQSMPIDMKFGS